MPVAACLVVDNETEPFQTLEIFGNGIQFFLCSAAFELGGDLGGAPFAGGGAEEVADGGELFFRFGGPFLLQGGFDDGFFFGGDAFESGLGFDGFVGGLVVGAEPADEAVAFFFGAFGVEGDEVFEDLFVGDGVGPAVGVEDGGV